MCHIAKANAAGTMQFAATDGVPCGLPHSGRRRITYCYGHSHRLLLRNKVNGYLHGPKSARDVMSTEFEPASKELPEGQLQVSFISERDIPGTSVVLTRAFAASPQAIPIEECKTYCYDMLDRMPEGAFLVGRLYPKQMQDGSAPDWLPDGQESRVIATAAISFDPKSRENFLSQKPPDDEAYLCNIAVVRVCMRDGI